MPYHDVTPYVLYNFIAANDCRWGQDYISAQKARAWVEAEIVFRGWEVVQRNFELTQRLDDDEREGRYQPDPDHCPGQRVRAWRSVQRAYFSLNTPDLVRSLISSDEEERRKALVRMGDAFVEVLDEDFGFEKMRMQGRKFPNFSRMKPEARVDFAQAIIEVVKTPEEIGDEADERLGRGEEFPHPREKAA